MAYDFKNDPTNPDAYPLYNNNMFKVWNWFNTVWSCNDWITYHKSLKSKYGKTKADETFLSFWNDLATGSSAIDCRTFNSSFRDYMRKERLLDALYDGLGFIAKPIGAAGDIITGAGNVATSAVKTAENLAKLLATLIPIVVIVAVILIGLHYYKKSKGGK